MDGSTAGMADMDMAKLLQDDDLGNDAPTLVSDLRCVDTQARGKGRVGRRETGSGGCVRVCKLSFESCGATPTAEFSGLGAAKTWPHQQSTY
jgi:hypothetical protein